MVDYWSAQVQIILNFSLDFLSVSHNKFVIIFSHAWQWDTDSVVWENKKRTLFDTVG